jgi:DUF1365 family protein
MMPSVSLAHAHIRHRRYTPKPHAFEYEMGYILADIDNLSQVCKRSPFWSYNKFNFISLYDKDLLSTEGLSVRETLREAISQQLGQPISATQPIYVLTLPRYLGAAFNPVTFYWVYDETDVTTHTPALKYIAAHITNTPWHERFLYCFSCAQSEPSNSISLNNSYKQKPVYRFLLDKQFHVSPFMPMDLKYDWRFKLDQDKDPNYSAIHMQLKQHGELVFDATMKFTLTPLSVKKQNLFPFIYPLQSLKIVTAIYWQALRLYMKKIPFFTNPTVSKEYQ